MIQLFHPVFLILIVLIPASLYFYRKYGKERESVFRYSGVRFAKEIIGSRHRNKKYLLIGLRWLAVLLMIIGLARPRLGDTIREFSTEGIDIILVLDISSSMRAVDFKPNRLEAAKSVAIDFIKSRQNDRIGLIVFASESFLQCPATIDYDVLRELIGNVSIIPERFDGTAIGMAIANGVNRLRNLDAKSKVMILLSDGRNNAGELDPLTAADLAKTFDIKIYTIGAGKEGQALYPMDTPIGGQRLIPMEVEIDEKILKEIAHRTGGKYFRATDEKSLAEIYREISEMEKTEIKVKDYIQYAELYPYFLLPALILLALEGLLSRSIIRKFP